MAVSPYSNEAFLREVDEELRRDELMGFWKRWGRWVAVAIGVGLIAFGGFLYWQHHRDTVAGQQGEQMQAAFDQLGAGQTAAAQPALATLAASKADGYRASAIFSQADLLLQRGDYRGAAAKFAGVAADGSQPQPFRDLALVRQTAAEFDLVKPQVVVDRLRQLTVPGNAFFGSAGEMTAAAYLAMGRRDLAATLFGQVGQDAGVPASIRQRAVQMAGALASGAPAASAAAANKDRAR